MEKSGTFQKIGPENPSGIKKGKEDSTHKNWVDHSIVAGKGGRNRQKRVQSKKSVILYMDKWGGGRVRACKSARGKKPPSVEKEKIRRLNGGGYPGNQTRGRGRGNNRALVWEGEYTHRKHEGAIDINSRDPKGRAFTGGAAQKVISSGMEKGGEAQGKRGPPQKNDFRSDT